MSDANVPKSPEQEFYMKYNLSQPPEGGVKVADPQSPHKGAVGFVKNRDLSLHDTDWTCSIDVGGDVGKVQFVQTQLKPTSVVQKADRAVKPPP